MNNVSSRVPARREIPVTNREIFGWAMFDFANSSFTTVVITAVYGAFFVGYIVPPSAAARDSYWSIAMILSVLATLALAPFAGAIIDLSGRKKAWLVASCLICSLGTAGLFFADPGEIGFAIAMLVIGNVGFMLSESFNASFLPDLATPQNMGKISGLGWGIGYFGGLSSVVIARSVIIRADPTLDRPAFVSQNQQAMLAVAIFFVVAALPTFIFLRNRSLPAPGFERAGVGRLIAAGWSEFRASASVARRHRVLFQFFLAFMVYMAGLDAVIKFVGIYAQNDVGLGGNEFALLFVLLQLSAVAGAFGFGYLESRLGPKKTVLATLVWWMIGIGAIYQLDFLASLTGLPPKKMFFGVGLMAGAGIGATQSASRTVVGLLSPKERAAQMFGFWSMFSRLSTILAMSFGFAADFFGSRRAGLILVLGFFVVGALLLARVDVDRGIEDVASG